MNNYKKKIYAQIHSSGPNLKMDLARAIDTYSSVSKDTFFVLLFHLFIKADKDNYNKLKSSYPKEAAEYEKYKEFGLNPDESEIVIGPDFK